MTEDSGQAAQTFIADVKAAFAGHKKLGRKNKAREALPVMKALVEGAREISEVPSELGESFVQMQIQALFGYATCLSTLQKSDAALEVLDEAETITSEPAQIWYRKGHIYKRRNDLDEALEAFDRAAALDPNWSEPLVMRGDIYYKNLDQYDDAHREYDLALDRDPSDYEALDGKAAAYERDDQPDKAVEYYRLSLEIHPNNPACTDGIERLQNNGKSRIPLRMARLYEDAKSHMGEGDYEKALPLLKEYLAAYPDRPQISYEAGAAALHCGHYDEAIPYFERCLQDGQYDMRASSAHGIGLCNINTERLADARRSFEQALDIHMKDREFLGPFGRKVARLLRSVLTGPDSASSSEIAQRIRKWCKSDGQFKGIWGTGKDHSPEKRAQDREDALSDFFLHVRAWANRGGATVFTMDRAPVRPVDRTARSVAGTPPSPD